MTINKFEWSSLTFDLSAKVPPRHWPELFTHTNKTLASTSVGLRQNDEMGGGFEISKMH